MMTVSEVSRLAHISKRTLQYYDRIGLLCPSARSAAGYRLYSESDLERLQQILLFRELEFPLSEIHRIMNAPGYDRTDALEKQIEMLSLKKEHLENLITFARGVQMLGVKNMKSMDFSVFDSRKNRRILRARRKSGRTHPKCASTNRVQRTAQRKKRFS